MSTKLSELLFELSNALLVPVVVALFFACASTAFALGGFVREGIDRRRSKRRRTVSAVEFARLRSEDGSAVDERSLVDALELALEARLTRLGLGARLAPMLGLMGTLVPLGPAFVDVADGRLEGFGEKLVVAFATTVVGVLVGGLCHVMLVVRRDWWARDLHELDHAPHDSTSRSEEA